MVDFVGTIRKSFEGVRWESRKESGFCINFRGWLMRLFSAFEERIWNAKVRILDELKMVCDRL